MLSTALKDSVRGLLTKRKKSYAKRPDRPEMTRIEPSRPGKGVWGVTSLPSIFLMRQDEVYDDFKRVSENPPRASTLT